MTMTATETDNPLVFQQMKYCDSCSSALAKHRVWIDRWRLDESGNGTSLDLVLCGHHYSKHESAIVAAGYEVDEV